MIEACCAGSFAAQVTRVGLSEATDDGSTGFAARSTE